MSDFDYNADDVDDEEDGFDRVSFHGPDGDSDHSELHSGSQLSAVVLHVQDFIPTRDNVIFLIDVQQSMFEKAGLKHVEVGSLNIPVLGLI